MLYLYLLIALFLTTPASAAQFTVSANVFQVNEPDNVFGLQPGDKIFWQVSYPDSWRSIPGEVVFTRDDLDVSVFVQIGSVAISLTNGIFALGIRNGSPYQVLTETGDFTDCPVCLTGPWIGDVSADDSAAYVSYTSGSDRNFDVLGDAVTVADVAATTREFSATPEPSTLILLALPLLLLLSRSRLV